ncbi:MAG: type 1 glutamine amidotransferase domain-containing protein [Acidobacteriota bacterium]
MDKQLSNLKVAILVENGFEQVELTEPKKALEAAGAVTQIVSPAGKKVKGWQHTQWGDEFPVDVALDNARSDEFDALLLPGGVINPDKLRITPRAIAFIKEFFDAGKPVAAICHGPCLLIDAGAAKGRTLTSWHSIKTDLLNAGAKWVDRDVVNENGLVTSRKPDDIPAFNREMISLFSQQTHRQSKFAERTGRT